MHGDYPVEKLNVSSPTRKALVRIKVGKHSVVHVIQRKSFSPIERSLVVQCVLEP